MKSAKKSGGCGVPTNVRGPALKPKPRGAKLCLFITGTLYYLFRLDPDPDVAALAWRLQTTGQRVYDVALMARGPECDCDDAVWRRKNNTPRGCKHIEALKEVGLL